MSEFGALLCWATNAIGEQRVPCVTRVSPAGGSVVITDQYCVPRECDKWVSSRWRSVVHYEWVSIALRMNQQGRKGPARDRRLVWEELNS